jgi:hypothetical protein
MCLNEMQTVRRDGSLASVQKYCKYMIYIGKQISYWFPYIQFRCVEVAQSFAHAGAHGHPMAGTRSNASRYSPNGG